MTVWQLILKEVAHRKLTFFLGLLSVTVAVACLVGSLTLLKAHDLQTTEIINEKVAESRERMEKLKDDTRKLMKQLGYNVLILAKNQDLAELQDKGYATHYFSANYADRLIEANIQTLSHLLPMLQQKITWPEQGREIIVIGIRGQVASPNDGKVPIMLPVPRGKADVGHAIADRLKLSPGDTITLMGEKFVVNKRFKPRSMQDDNTIWINLDVAQRLLNQPGRINGILALECLCVPDALGRITEEVTTILPDTQVFEFSSLARVRTEARNSANAAATEVREAEEAHRAALKHERERLFSVIVPLVLAGCALWVMLLTFGNVRERRAEIGILRAIGVPSNRILQIFVGKAMLIGLVGAVIGFIAGLVFGAGASGYTIDKIPIALFSPLLLLVTLVLAPVLTGLASYPPAMLAAEQDPASVLREE